MTSVEYTESALVWNKEMRIGTHPETGEEVTREVAVEKRPFDVRISKWLERSDGYHIHGFVKVTALGQSLASEPEPFEWLSNNYQIAEGVTYSIVTEWLRGVAFIQTNKLDEILSFGGVHPIDTIVTDDSEWRMDFEVVLSGATTFDVEWLTVDFDPSRGG